MFGKTLFDLNHSEAPAAAATVLLGGGSLVPGLAEILSQASGGQNKTVAIITGVYALLRAYSNWRKARRVNKALKAATPAT